MAEKGPRDQVKLILLRKLMKNGQWGKEKGNVSPYFVLSFIILSYSLRLYEAECITFILQMKEIRPQKV